MNLLFANDRAGEYPASYYAATRSDLAPFPALAGEVRADVCIVGGGYTGLSAALHLAQAGRRVVLLEAHRVGFGASGRNGGQVGSGQRLDQVESVEAGGLLLRPDGLTRDGAVDRLRLVAQGDKGAGEAGSEMAARIRLRDGRTVTLAVTMAAARPQVGLLSKDISLGAPPVNGKALALNGDNLLPDNGQLVFSVRAGEGTKLSASDVIEVARMDEDAAPIRLTAANGLRLEGPKVMVARLDPKAMAPALFGPLHFRLLHGNEASDWQPLVTLARLPQIDAVACEGDAQACTIRGRDLFLIDAVGATSSLDQASQVAQGYTGSALKAPAPLDGKLYLRLRDAPDSVVTLPAA